MMNPMMSLPAMLAMRQALQQRLGQMPPRPGIQPIQGGGMPMGRPMNAPPQGLPMGVAPGQPGPMQGGQMPITTGMGIPALTNPQTIGEARTQPRIGSLLTGNPSSWR